MASITQTTKGYRAQVYVLGVRDSAGFRTRREAVAWAAARETELRTVAALPAAERHTLADALARYRDEVSVHKRGRRWEEIRLAAFLRSSLPVARKIGTITPDDIGAWRDDRLRSVGNGTVLREIALLSAVFEAARREWRWIPANPVADVRKPRQPDHRDTVLTRRQIKAMLRALGYSPTLPIRSITQAVAVAFLLALRTGMRAGELCALKWPNVHEGFCSVPHKTGSTAAALRDVPLTPRAMRIVGRMRGFDPVRVFGTTPQTLDTLFRRARDRAGLAGFVFHDTRHTAATWLAQELHILDLCKMFGWRGTGQAMTYYNPSAAEIAGRIGARKNRAG